MTRHFTRWLTGAAGAAVLGLSLATAGMAVHAQDAGTAVEIRNFAFDPAEVRVAVDGRVTWTNADGAAHTVTALEGAFDSGRLARGEAFTLEAGTLAAGTYEYRCNIHPSMRGTLVIEAPAP